MVPEEGSVNVFMTDAVVLRSSAATPEPAAGGMPRVRNANRGAGESPGPGSADPAAWIRP